VEPNRWGISVSRSGEIHPSVIMAKTLEIYERMGLAVIVGGPDAETKTGG